MSGDIETAAGLPVKEPDDGVVHFARWRPFDQNALSRSPILAPAGDRPDPGMEEKGLRGRPLAHETAGERTRAMAYLCYFSHA